MVNANVLVCGRDAVTSQAKPFGWNRGALDVYLQDQTTPIVNYRLHQDIRHVALSSAVAINATTIELLAGHGAVVGNLLTVLYNNGFYQGFIVNVAGNTITLDIPFPRAFPVSATCILGRFNANVNGSVTTQVFHAKPPSGSVWDIVKMCVQLVDDAAMDYTKFAGIAALTNGCVLRKRDGNYDNIGNVKRNGDFSLFGCYNEIVEKTGGGEYAFNSICQFGGQSNAGVTIRLDGSQGDEIELLIQDDLTAISNVYVVLIGHEVE